MRDAGLPDGAAEGYRRRWVGFLGCLCAIALIVLLATAIVWWTQSGIFAPSDRLPLPGRTVPPDNPPASNQP